MACPRNGDIDLAPTKFDACIRAVDHKQSPRGRDLHATPLREVARHSVDGNRRVCRIGGDDDARTPPPHESIDEQVTIGNDTSIASDVRRLSDQPRLHACERR